MKLLSNAPLGEDLFEGKSQEFIANAIVEELENNASQEHRSDCQKMIGIEGSWGSGKSNLIKIVENKITKTHPQKFHFFTYDVWGHQEDLQRKAILNELIDFLLKNEILCKKDDDVETDKWKEKVKQTTGTITETTQVQLPHISWGVFFCVLILIITPVCEGIANLNYFDNHLLGRLLVASVPLFLLFLLYFGWLDKKCRKEKKCFFPTKKLFKETFAEILCVYEDKKIESTNREFINETNPSVIDFRNLLKGISDTLHDRNKHLVINFDNMDRLPKEKIESLWSSIHTFFAENNGYTNISCIVSFDRSHIRAAFPSNEDTDKGHGDGYIDKTFDVVYRVAAPVLVDWKKFFERKWKEAFENEFNPIEYEYVIQAYDILSDSSNPVPRSIIRFINECVLLKRTFRDIPERYIAIFNLKKDALLNRPLDMICLNNNLQSIYEHDPKYYDYITALVYQVPPENAISVIYKQALYKALEQHNQKELIDISQAPFFKDILEDALNYFALLKDPIVSLDELGDIPLSEEQQRKLWRELYFRSAKSMQFDSGRIEPFQMVLLKHLEKEQKTELIQKILAPFKNIDFSGPRDIYGQSGREYTSEEYVELLKNMEKVVPRDELKGFLQKISIKTETHKNLLQKIVDIDWIPFECK